MLEAKLNPEALDSYCKSFTTLILQKFYSEYHTISGEQIVNLTPVKQINFFVLKVLFSQWQEETKKFKSPLFDYNNEGVKDALKILVNTLSKNIAIERVDFEPLLEIAVKDTLMLIYEPDYFFEKEINAFGTLNYAAPFRGMSKYIKIRKDIFNRISGELNEGNIENNSSELTSLIFSSCENATLEDTASSINLFAQILPLDILEEDVMPNTVDEEVEEISTYEPSEKEDSIEEQEIPTPIEEPSDTNMDDEFEPVAQEADEMEELEEKVTEIESEAEPEPPSNINEQFASESNIINEQFEEELKPVRTIVEQHQEQKTSELHSSISVNQRYMFLNDLFEGDVEAYNTAISDIENFNSFDNSVEYLMQNYSRKYQWDMTSDEVKELLKVIFKRFR